MRYKLAIVFSQPPFGSSASREGLDALLAASSFCDEDEMLIVFLGDGVYNLLAHQQPEKVLQKDHISTFKLIELYDLPHCLVCEEDVQQRQLSKSSWVLNQAQFVARSDIFNALQQAEKILTF